MSKPNNVSTVGAKAPNATPTGSSTNNAFFAPAVIVGGLILSELVYHLVMGAGSRFEGGDHKNHVLNADPLGLMYKGGFIVPILMTCALCVIVFSIERYLTLRAAEGNGSIADFIKRIKGNLDRDNVDAAIGECDKQKGSVANVVRSGLVKYKEMLGNTELDMDQKVGAIQTEIEETTALEMPMLQRNMAILSTLASVGTLIALLGTVLGMIRSFAALGASGAGDSSALANGISEALINTALGIGTSACAIILFNYFTAKIDGMSYRIDEASFTISQAFATQHKK